MEETKNLDPKDIEQFKTAFQLARQFLYQKQVFDSLVQDAQNNPVNAISGAVVTVLLRVQEEVGQLSLAVAGALGIALLDEVGETLEQSGIMQNSKELQMELFQASTLLWLQSNKYPDEVIAQELQDMGAPLEVIQQIMQSSQGGQGQPGQAPPQQPQQAPPEGQGLLRRGA